MLRSRARRALTLLVLVCSVLAMPPTVWAAAPREDAASSSAVTRIWDWILSTWGRGSGGVDPSGVVRQSPPAPSVADGALDTGPSAASSPSARDQRARAD